MATQAVISLVDERGRTIKKVVTGIDGQFAPNFAARWAENTDATLRDVYDMASTYFGTGSLVVYSKWESITPDDDDLPASYADTFNEPRWNPRWHYGTADYVEIVYYK
jgi:hypothetical protein